MFTFLTRCFGPNESSHVQNRSRQRGPTPFPFINIYSSPSKTLRILQPLNYQEDCSHATNTVLKSTLLNRDSNQPRKELNFILVIVLYSRQSKNITSPFLLNPIFLKNPPSPSPPPPLMLTSGDLIP